MVARGDKPRAALSSECHEGAGVCPPWVVYFAARRMQGPHHRKQTLSVGVVVSADPG